MKYDLCISIGSNCDVAFALKKLNLRKESFPFDWLLISYQYGLAYVSQLIETNFNDFLYPLEYDENNKVYPVKYPKLKFYHHDLIANLVYKNEDYNNISDLTETFKKRAQRFMNVLTSNINVLLIYYFKNNKKNNQKNINILIDGIRMINNTIDNINLQNNKCNKLLLIVGSDENSNIKLELNKQIFNNVDVVVSLEEISIIIKNYVN